MVKVTKIILISAKKILILTHNYVSAQGAYAHAECTSCLKPNLVNYAI